MRACFWPPPLPPKKQKNNNKSNHIYIYIYICGFLGKPKGHPPFWGPPKRPTHFVGLLLLPRQHLRHRLQHIRAGRDLGFAGGVSAQRAGGKRLGRLFSGEVAQKEPRNTKLRRRGHD